MPQRKIIQNTESFNIGFSEKALPSYYKPFHFSNRSNWPSVKSQIQCVSLPNSKKLPVV